MVPEFRILHIFLVIGESAIFQLVYSLGMFATFEAYPVVFVEV
jgi:hypothetical protein